MSKAKCSPLANKIQENTQMSVKYLSYQELEYLSSQTDNPQSNNNKQEGPSDSNYARI
jgi:hypothetical protein